MQDLRTASPAARATTSAATRTRLSSAVCNAACRCSSIDTLAGLHRTAGGGWRRDHTAVPRPSDPGHQLLSRQRDVRHHRARRHAAVCSRTSTRTTRCAFGCPAAPPARKPIRWQSCCYERMITMTGQPEGTGLSAQTSMSRQSRPRALAAIRQRCWKGSRRNAAPGFSQRATTATLSRKKSASCARSRHTALCATRRSRAWT